METYEERESETLVVDSLLGAESSCLSSAPLTTWSADRGDSLGCTEPPKRGWSRPKTTGCVDWAQPGLLSPTPTLLLIHRTRLLEAAPPSLVPVCSAAKNKKERKVDDSSGKML